MKKNPKWIGAEVCSCGNKKVQQAKICNMCWYKKMKGKNNPNWKGGNFCKCGNKIIMNRAKICRKCYNETRFAEGNPNWRGGKSFEPYNTKFNSKLKEQIRKRDSYRCQQCFRHQDEIFTKNGKKRKLDIHHIDYDKQNNGEKNLISLCKVCHSQTNFGRNEWNKYFKQKTGGMI